MKYCMKCGQALADDARFCVICGTKCEETSAIDTQLLQQEIIAAQPVNTKKTSKGRSIASLICGIAGLSYGGSAVALSVIAFLVVMIQMMGSGMPEYTSYELVLRIGIFVFSFAVISVPASIVARVLSKKAEDVNPGSKLHKIGRILGIPGLILGIISSILGIILIAASLTNILWVVY